MGAILHLMRKEFLQVGKDRAMLAVIFVIPIVQLFVLGYAITTDIKNISLAILDYDNTSDSRHLVERFAHSPRFRLILTANDRRLLQQSMEKSESSLSLVIEKGFSEAIRRKQAPSVQLIVDGVDSNSALIAAGYARSIIMDHFRNLSGISGIEPVRLRAFYNQSLESRLTVVPGIVAVLLTVITIMLTALGLVREREIGTLEQLNVTPIRPFQLILGKILPFAILGGIAFIIALTVASFWFKIPMEGSALTLGVFTCLYLLSTLGLGMFVSTITSTQQQAVFFSWFILVTSILMSGFMFPISNMPEILQKFTYLIPLRYYIEALRDILLKGSGLAELGLQLNAMAIFGTVIFSLSVLMFRKRT